MRLTFHTKIFLIPIFVSVQQGWNRGRYGTFLKNACKQGKQILDRERSEIEGRGGGGEREGRVPEAGEQQRRWRRDYYRKTPNRLPNFCLIDTKSCLIAIWRKSRGYCMKVRFASLRSREHHSRVANISTEHLKQFNKNFDHRPSISGPASASLCLPGHQ